MLMKLNYEGIISFPKKLKFDHINIFKNVLIMEQKIVNTSPSDTLISLKSSLWMLKFYAVLEYRWTWQNILVTGDNAIHRKRVYLQNNESSIFEYTVKVFRNSPNTCHLFRSSKAVTIVSASNNDNILFIAPMAITTLSTQILR